MKVLVSLLCTALLSGCASWMPWAPAMPRPEPTLAHPYLGFPESQSAIKNLNPDVSDPWMVGGLILPTDEELWGVPVMGPSGAVMLGDMPERVDNSTKKYFRGIFSQKNGSCAQASAIAYVYTYEVNRLRGTSALEPSNRYPTHWTYNFVNNGYDRGSWMMWGWEVAKSMGVPDVKTYGTETGYDLRYWPSQYETYATALDNKVEKYFIMRVSNVRELAYAKQFLATHGGTNGEGGLLSFAAGWSTGYKEAVIPQGQYEAGKKLIASFGGSVNHAITFVGYDDKVCYDFNKDGVCSNNKDTNGDGIIDIKDFEVGAFIMANSWGTGWGNKGFIYVPYRLATMDPKDGGIYRQYVYGVVPAKDVDKSLVLRVKATHDRRSELKFMGALAQAGNPRYYRYYGLQNSGGAFPLNGTDSAPVEFGFDMRPLMQRLEPEPGFTLSSIIDSRGGGVGELIEMEIIDYGNGETVMSRDKNLEIKKGRTVATASTNDDDEPDPDPEPDPEPEPCGMGPVAAAGKNVVVSEHCLLVLDGSESYDDDGEIVSYQWRQRRGKQKLKIEKANTAEPVVFIPEVKRDEKYQLELRVTDDDGFVTTDRVWILVKNRI